MFGEMALENFKPYQKINGLQSAAYYPYSEKVSFTNASLLKIYFFQQFAGQFVAEVSLKKQKELSPEFNFPQYLEIAMQTIDKLTGGATTTEPIKAIFIARVLEEMERNNKFEWSDEVNAILSDLVKKSGNKHFLQLKKRVESISKEGKFWFPFLIPVLSKISLADDAREQVTQFPWIFMELQQTDQSYLISSGHPVKFWSGNWWWK